MPHSWPCGTACHWVHMSSLGPQTSMVQGPGVVGTALAWPAPAQAQEQLARRPLSRWISRLWLSCHGVQRASLGLVGVRHVPLQSRWESYFCSELPEPVSSWDSLRGHGPGTHSGSAAWHPRGRVSVHLLDSLQRWVGSLHSADEEAGAQGRPTTSRWRDGGRGGDRS